MKKYSVIGLLSVLLLAGGCDFLRSMAGRPTTEELTTLRQQAEEQPVPVEDTVAVAMEDEEAWPDILSVEAPVPASPVSGYLVIVGAYRVPRHAQRSAERYRRLGYEASIVKYGAVELVGLCPAGDREEARRSLSDLRAKGVGPKGSWILKRK